MKISHSRYEWKRWLPLLIVLLTVAIVFIPLLIARDYLYDDIIFIMVNPDFFSIHGLKECFTFVLQPSKPITNFFLALGYLIGHGRVTGQHLLSLVLHLAVGATWYFNLVKWGQRSKTKVPAGFYLAMVAVYLALPVHSEALQIAQFRGEILATLFAGLAVLLTQMLATSKSKSRYVPFSYYVGIFVFLGMSQLSKEVFAAIVPPLCLLFYVLPGTKPTGRKRVTRFISLLVVFELIWAPLYLFLRRDAGGHYTYSYTVGWKVIPLYMHVVLASRAILEAMVKLLTGRDLTVTRIMFRHGPGAHFPMWLHGTVVVSALLGTLWLCTRKGWIRVWAVTCCLAGWIYLVIPNANIGSEHYFYFSSFGFLVLLGLASWKLFEKFTDHPKFLWWLSYGVFTFYSIAVLETRLFECSSRVNQSRAEVEHYPEYYGNWVGYATSLIVDRADKKEIDRALAKAKEMVGERGDVLKAEFNYAMAYQSFEATENSFVNLMNQVTDRRERSFYEIEFARYAFVKGECGMTMGMLHAIKKLDETEAARQVLEDHYAELIRQFPNHCKSLAGTVTKADTRDTASQNNQR